MAVTDYSTTPDSNTLISGINIAEGWAAANANNAFRQLMADVRVMYNGLPVTADLMPKIGGQFSGAIGRVGKGHYIFHDSTSCSSGRIIIQASGGAVPSMADGDWLLEY